MNSLFLSFLISLVLTLAIFLGHLLWILICGKPRIKGVEDWGPEEKKVEVEIGGETYFFIIPRNMGAQDLD